MCVRRATIATKIAAEMSSRRTLDVNIRSGPQMLEYEAIADRIAAETRGPLLDWGCGHGQLTHLLRERGVATEAFDYRDGAEEPGTERLEHYPDIVANVSGDPVRLPFEDRCFEAALSCGVLEHVQRPEDSLAELRRVLRPRGRLYVYKLPNRLSYLEAIARVGGFYYHGKLPHDRIYTTSSARALLEQGGFEVTDVRLTNLLPLTITAPSLQHSSGTIWSANLVLGKLPGLKAFATNVEVDAFSR
jgi:ubiquinone/menaquinone biosynthesis C-methylase UbiE